jgi:tRNA threonylcarbamoyladenosine modification (KEOPS) complex  Pcc1 subunit
MSLAKKALLPAILFIACLSVAAAQEQEMGAVDYMVFSRLSNQMEKSVFRVKYDQAAGSYSLYLARNGGAVSVRLADPDLAKLRAAMQKYLEWEKLALSKEVELDKDIPDSGLSCAVSWENGKERLSAPSLKLSFHFLSRNKLVHWLRIDSKPAEADSKKGASLELDVMYLEKGAVLGFLDVISEKNIAAKEKAREEKRALEELFK